MDDFDTIGNCFGYFKHEITEGKIFFKGQYGEEYDAKVNNLAKQLVECCDNDIHNAVMFGIFSFAFTAGKQHMCRICKEIKNNRHD